MKLERLRALPTLGAMLLVAACGGGGGGTTPPPPPPPPPPPVTLPPAAPELAIGPSAVKAFDFIWNPVSGATSYKLLEDADGISGYSAVPNASNLTFTSYRYIVPLFKRVNARYILQACNAGGCTDSAPVSAPANLAAAIGYGKAPNSDAGDAFGTSVALSADGTTLAVGARSEASNASGINGDQTNNSAPDSGAVYVFVRDGNVWSLQAYIKASNVSLGDAFGISVALAADGNTLAVGATGEDSNAIGVGGNQNDNSAQGSGAVYVFTRNAGAWSQQAYVKASNTDASDLFGSKLTLAADGNTLAVAAEGESSNATGVGGNQANNSAMDSGAVYVYVRSGGTWSQQAYVKASNTQAYDNFGSSLALAADGNTLATGADGEDSNARGIGFDQSNNVASLSGAVYVFARTASIWSQQAYVKASNTGASDQFGCAVTLAADGNTLAVGARYEGSNATGIDGNQGDDSVSTAGAVYVFTRTAAANVWSQQAYVKASNTRIFSLFGGSLSVSADGSTLAVGAANENSRGTGLNGNQTDATGEESGAVYVFARDAAGGVWAQRAFVKANNTGVADWFGSSVALAADGNTLVAGSIYEDGAARGFTGNPNDNSAANSGAVYLY